MSTSPTAGTIPTTTAARSGVTTRTRWLDEREMGAWRSYAETVGDLATALEADLAEHDLTLGDYQVLVYLSEASDQSMRMCDLAGRLQLSPSGLTRRLDGLVRAGLIARTPSDHDRRVMLASLTPAGMQRLVEAAPTHVASVRRRLLDHVADADLDAMRRIFTSVRATLDADRALPTSTTR